MIQDVEGLVSLKAHGNKPEICCCMYKLLGAGWKLNTNPKSSIWLMVTAAPLLVRFILRLETFGQINFLNTEYLKSSTVVLIVSLKRKKIT